VPLPSRKKPLSSLPLSSKFAIALFFAGLTLTMTSSSFMIVFADDAKVTASGYNFITTTSSAGSLFRIPLLTEEDEEDDDGDSSDDKEEDKDEDEEDEEKPMGNAVPSSSPLRVAFVKPSFTYAAYQLNGF
jgi:hypothetical protein